MLKPRRMAPLASHAVWMPVALVVLLALNALGASGKDSYEEAYLESYATAKDLYEAPCPDATKLGVAIQPCTKFGKQSSPARSSSCPATDSINCWMRVRYNGLTGWITAGTAYKYAEDGDFCSYPDHAVTRSKACRTDSQNLGFVDAAWPIYASPSLASAKLATVQPCLALYTYTDTLRHTSAAVPDKRCWVKASFDGVTGWMSWAASDPEYPCEGSKFDSPIFLMKPKTCSSTASEAMCGAYYFPRGGGYTKSIIKTLQCTSINSCCYECSMMSSCQAWSFDGFVLNDMVGTCNLTSDSSQALDPSAGRAMYLAYSLVVRRPTGCLKLPGYAFYPLVDSTKGNLGLKTGASRAALAAACTKEPKCQGFNTWGQLKGSIATKDRLMPLNPLGDACKGLYVKNSVTVCPHAPPPGYIFYEKKDDKATPGYNNNLPKPPTSLAGNVPALANKCDRASACIAFNTAGYLKRALRPSNKWSTMSAACSGLYVKKKAGKRLM